VRHSFSWGKVLYFTAVTVAALVTTYPLIWLLGASFVPERYIFEHTGIIPRHFTLENYAIGWQGVSGVTFLDYFVNSFTIVALVDIGTVLSCSMAAFAFSRLEFSGRGVLFVAMLLTMMLPMHVTLIPRYVMFYNLGWVDSYKPLTVPSFFAVGGFFIFLMVQFMRGLPSELDQAARVDGCSPVGIYLRIILPLSTPALVTAAIFSTLWTYNDFFSQLLYINNPTRYTVALGLRAFSDATSRSAYGPLFAMSVVSLIPIVAFFLGSQNLLIEGIATTGLKG